MTRPDETTEQARRFADEAGRRRKGALGELVDFLRHNKKWWLAPIVIMLLLVGVLVVLGGTVLAPLIYPLI
jgi:ATP-dependent Zn protease